MLPIELLLTRFRLANLANLHTLDVEQMACFDSVHRPEVELPVPPSCQVQLAKLHTLVIRNHLHRQPFGLSESSFPGEF